MKNKIKNRVNHNDMINEMRLMTLQQQGNSSAYDD